MRISNLKYQIWTAACVFVMTACADPHESTSGRAVVVFTSLDRVYSEPILRSFEEQTGIEVLPVYDAEAAKTTGLVSRLITRRGDPECDVLWNNESLQTKALAGMGLFQPYRSANAERIPARFRDLEGLWTGFAARMRVVIYNKEVVGTGDPPSRLSDFLDPRWRGRCAMASPFYGTTFTHVSLLHGWWGAEGLERWLTGLRSNAVVVAPGNGPVRDLVAAGECAFGLTDTDDAHGAMLDGRSVGVTVPDGRAVLIPNTVSLVAGCPHAGEGRALIDFLLSPEVERRLAAGRSAQIPLGMDLSDVKSPWDGLLRDSPPADQPVGPAASREEVVAILRRTEMDR